ncbi:hypothetical protein L1276_002872 [Flavobacterium sp. HSC-32F16]|uniref:hypothetical protein n=1 Tax=Flavobacterium sp. HSC-32F16 TaxID=2910964 RepID=UPI0020A42C55|nr:hypothetical protein [Flavobacterium sp. HSC-32F16]MCP2027712.1 hypothetical protein [Flavobacterium sp. HSC-32F16]
MKNIDKVQSWLPLGYLFLIILGITKDGIFYYQLGINIIRYSSIMDILISPIAAVTSHPVFFITILVLFVFFYKLPQILVNNEDKKWIHKMFGMESDNPNFDQLSDDDRKVYYTDNSISFLSFFLVCVFLGYGFADGRSISNKIKNNKLTYDYKLNYNDKESENAYIIGSNTAYFFYLTQENPNIRIVPVASVKNLELIENKMLKN